MKKLKTLISVMLCAMLVLSLVVPSMAADTYSVTVENAKKNATYTLYKIFDFEKLSGSAHNDGDNSSDLKGVYTASNEMYNLLNVTNSGVTFGVQTTSTGNSYYVESVDAVKLSKFLHSNAASIPTAAKIGDKTPSTTGDITWDNLADDGYYFVDTTSGSLFILGTTANSVVIEDKNKEVTVTKNVSDDDEVKVQKNKAQIGETLKFESVVTIQAGTIDLILHDKMSDGLTLKPDTIKLTGIESGNYTIKKTGITDDCDFEIVFNQNYLNLIDEETSVTVTYNAILNENAEIGTDKNTNTTWASYSGLLTAEATTKTTTLDVQLTKTNEAGDQIENAEFELYIVGQDTPIKLVKNGNKYRVATAEQIADNSVTKLTTITAGKVTIEGLDLGRNYQLLEINAPDGYNRLKDPTDIKETAADFEDLSIENSTGTELPSTGGTGTKILFTVGGIMMVVAFVLFTSKRRMAAED